MVDGKTFDRGSDMGTLKLIGKPEQVVHVGFMTGFKEPSLILSNPTASRDRYTLPIDEWEDKGGNRRGLLVFLKNPNGYGRDGRDHYRRSIWGDQLVRAIASKGGGVSIRIFAEEGLGVMNAQFDLTREEVQIILEDHAYLTTRREKHKAYFTPPKPAAVQNGNGKNAAPPAPAPKTPPVKEEVDGAVETNEVPAETTTA